MLERIGREVSLAIIGYGCRGQTQMEVLMSMPDVKIVAVCDRYADRMEKAAARVQEKQGHLPFATQNAHEAIACKEAEGVVIMTGWETHIPLAIHALKCGKYPALEVGGACALQECWDLVNASEQAAIPVMLLENCCYNREEMALLRMIRKGVFGEVVHCEGAYSHDLRDEIGLGDVNRHYRQKHFLSRNGELYPTHELGPIAKYLRLNRGNRMVSLVAMASKSAGLRAWLQENRPDTPLKDAQVNQGDVVTTLIKCANGETICLTHDCTTPRPYSRGGVIRGTKGLWQEEGRFIYVEGDDRNPDHKPHHWESDAPFMRDYEHPLWKEYQEFGMRGGHGGMDYLVLRAYVESLQNGTPAPIDVYDTAAWMAVTALSEESIAKGSVPVAVPDFTRGQWMYQRPEDGDIFALDEGTHLE